MVRVEFGDHPIWSGLLKECNRIQLIEEAKKGAYPDIGRFVEALYKPKLEAAHFRAICSISLQPLATKISLQCDNPIHDKQKRWYAYCACAHASPNSPLAAWAHLKIGKLLRKKEGEEERAAKHFKKVRELTHLAKAGEASLYLAELEKEVAKTHYEFAISLGHSPYKERASFLLARYYEEVEKNYPKAVECYTLASATLSEALYILAVIYDEGREGVEKNPDKAIELYEAVYADVTSSKYGEAHFRLAKLLEREKRGTAGEWIRHYQSAELIAQPYQVEARFCLARICFDQEQLQAAKELCLQIIDLGSGCPFFRKASLLLGHIAYQATSYVEAMSYYQAAIESEEEAVTNEASFLLGSLLAVSGPFQDLMRAKALYSELAERAPPEVAVKALFALSKISPLEEESRLLERVLLYQNPFYSFYAHVRLGDRLKCEEHYQKALDLKIAEESDQGALYMKMAEIKRQKGEFSAAIRLYEAVTRLKVHEYLTEALYRIGELSSLKKEQQCAKEAFEAALSVDSKNDIWKHSAYLALKRLYQRESLLVKRWKRVC